MADWRSRLDGLFEESGETRSQREATEMARFIEATVVPAFAELTRELEKHGREVTIRATDTSAGITVHHEGEEEIVYRVQRRIFPNTIVPYAEVRFRERKGLKLIRVESMFRSGKPDYGLADVSGEEVIGNFLQHYRRCIKPD
jgi:hypothetical protein